MAILAFAASLRRNSLNRKLIELASNLCREEGPEIDVVDFASFPMPVFDGDFEAHEGLPPGAVALVERIRASEAILIASPEYNYSICGPLKNAIDWTSRARPMPWRGRSVYLMSASPSVMGGIRGLWHTRVPLEGCGALVFPDMFALPHANHAFDERGELVDPKTAERLRTEMVGFLKLAEAVSSVCGETAPVSAKPRIEKIVAALEEQTELQSASS